MVCALFGFIACTQNPIEEQSAIRTDAPETIRVGFEDDETRIQLNEAQKTVWTKGDQVSVFYKSYDNLKFEFEGNTGDRNGTLKRVGGQHNGQTMDDVIVVYPYSADYMITLSEGCVNATIPSTQTYLKGSYGVGDNLMIARSSFNQFSLKSVCGWLKIQLTGAGEVIERITFRGNNGEQVAGLVYVDAATAEATLATAKHNSDDNSQLDGTLVLDDSIYTEVTLDCGEGVKLGAEATSFYISLPPQTFANGFTIEIEDTDGYAMEQSTAKTFVVERNTISPMAALEFINPAQPTPANNEIWYTNGSTTVATTPYETNVFGANIVSNTYDAEKECWVIKFDGEVTTIGREAFYKCSSLKSITIPDSVTMIVEYAFYDCSGLTSVTIPDSLIGIGGEGAFFGCSSLTSVYISNISAWCNISFADLYSNPLSNGCNLYLNNELVTDLTIPDNVTTIRYWAFSGCSSLTSVTIPDSVTSIGYAAFQGCSSLTSITVPDSVTTIGDYAFNNCSSLTSVTIPDSVTTIGEYVFRNCSNLQEFKGKFASEDGRYLIIDGTLNSFAPAGLTEYTIPDSVTSIGDYAFYYCRSLTSVTIHDSVTTIGESAFRGCSSLTSVTIGNSVTSIGDSAFSSCTSLTSVTIPDSVTTIGNSAFSWCESLTSVYCKATTPPDEGFYMFYKNASGRKIYVPMQSVEAYKSASYWSDYADAIVGYNF